MGYIYIYIRGVFFSLVHTKKFTIENFKVEVDVKKRYYGYINLMIVDILVSSNTNFHPTL